MTNGLNSSLERNNDVLRRRRRDQEAGAGAQERVAPEAVLDGIEEAEADVK